MITKLNNYKSTTWALIYKIDMNGYDTSKWENHEDYFVEQLDSIIEQQYKLGYKLSAITTFEYQWILVFQPK